VFSSAPSTQNAIARFADATGKAIRNSAVTISEGADIAGARTLALGGATAGTLTLAPAPTTVDHTLTFPGNRGAPGTFQQVADSNGALAWAAPGNATGANRSADNAVARLDATSGKIIQNSPVTISDAADVAGAKSLSLSGATAGAVTIAPAPTTADHTLTLPSDKGATGTFLQISNSATGALAWAVPPGTGDVDGPASATDTALARFDGSGGKSTRNSVVTLSNAGNMAGVASLMVAGKVSGVATPVAASDAANKQYVDGAVSGLKWKSSARVATTANLAVLSGLLVVDNVSGAVGNRVLVKDQTTGTQNGVYVVASGAWARAADLASGASAASAALYVAEGVVSGGKSFVCSNAAG
jgi:hypothetical protein